MTYDQLLEKLKADLATNQTMFPTAIWGWVFLFLGVALLVVGIIWGIMALSQVYGVWSAHKTGQAELAQAKNEQQIQTAAAQGRLSAAVLHKQAEIIDAEAVAKSVEIIGTALHNNSGYLQWQWIHMMKHNKNSVIYVPTEASLPILEAGKRPSVV